jgi:hypothetical protein
MDVKTCYDEHCEGVIEYQIEPLVDHHYDPSLVIGSCGDGEHVFQAISRTLSRTGYPAVVQGFVV